MVVLVRGGRDDDILRVMDDGKVFVSVTRPVGRVGAYLAFEG